MYSNLTFSNYLQTFKRDDVVAVFHSLKMKPIFVDTPCLNCHGGSSNISKEVADVINKTGASFIHPYDNFDVICGQGTAAVELLDDIDALDIVIAPVGGGGLLSGTSIAVKEISKKIKVFAAEPENANDAYKSFLNKKLIPSNNPTTIADGLLTSLSDFTFEIILKNVDSILLAKEKSIVFAMQMIWERMKIIVEPSAAVPLAAIIENRTIFENKKVGIILSGGNVELSKLPFDS